MTRRALSRIACPLPTLPGMYFWDAWGSDVEVIKRGRHLYVTPPCKGAVEIRVTEMIAGNFVRAK